MKKRKVDEGSPFAVQVRRVALKLEAEGKIEIKRDGKMRHVAYRLTPLGRKKEL